MSGTATSTAPVNPYDRVHVRWGQGREMNALEAALWRTSAHPSLRAASVVVEVLDRVPDWDRLVEGHAWALGRIPRLRQRVVDDPLRLGPPAWCDTDVDLTHHLRRVVLPAGAILDDALAVGSDLQEQEFDPHRPLWLGVLVEGLPDGRAVYLLKLHHALADGPAVIELFDLVHSSRREPTASKPVLPRGHHDHHTPLGLSATHALRLAAGLPRGAARVLGHGARGGAAAARRPGSAVHGLRRTVRAVGRAVAGAPGRPSPLLTKRGHGRRFDVVDVATADLRAVADATGTSLGEVFVAGVLGGVARYHAEMGATVGDLPAAIPTGMRLAGASVSRLARARMAAPAGIIDPLQRLRESRDRARAVHDAPPVDLVRATAAVLSRAPSPVLTRVAGGFTRACDLQFLTFRGLDRDAYVAGSKVERMAVLGPTSGCALTATLTSHGATCGIGLTSDPAAVTEPQRLRDAVAAAFAELVAAGRAA